MPLPLIEWIAMQLRRRHLELQGLDPDHDAIAFRQLKDSEQRYWLELAKTAKSAVRR